MLACFGGDLGEVGDGDNLHVVGHAAHDGADGNGDVAGNAAVDFVENDCGKQATTGYKRFDGEHEAREFTAGGNVGKGTRCAALVGIEKKANSVVAKRAVVGCCRDVGDNVGGSHAKAGKDGEQLFFEQ